VIVKYLLKIAMLGSSWVMYLLLLLSVASIGAMVERWWFFRTRGRGGDAMGDALCDLLEHGERDQAYALLKNSPTVEAEVLRASLRWAHGGPTALAAAIDGEMTKRRRELERGMTLLGTLGNNAPFVGLLGTVIGVIVAFADLADGQNKVQMDKVMGGIAEALVATGVGLFVAIPAVVAFNVFQKKIGDIEDNVASISQRLCAFVTVGKARDWVRPSEPPAAIQVAGDSVRDLGAINSEREVAVSPAGTAGAARAARAED
jgi:biopolymer transport protein ExbB/biopolymer transport protein TolQ